jgi:hypothetical protein
MWLRSLLGLLILSFLFLVVSALRAEEEAAPAPPPAAPAIDLTGEWSGTWHSCPSGHSGPLHATFCKACDTTYRVTFTGRFWKVFPFRYTVCLNVTGQEGDKLLLAGDANLGHLMGTFHYQADATDCEFHATYQSCRDHGTFCLRRCSRCANCCH